MRVAFVDAFEQGWTRPADLIASGPHVECKLVCAVRVLCSYAEIQRASVDGHRELDDLMLSALELLKINTQVRIDKELETAAAEYAIGAVSGGEPALLSAEVCVLQTGIWMLRGVREIARGDVATFMKKGARLNLRRT